MSPTRFQRVDCLIEPLLHTCSVERNVNASVVRQFKTSSDDVVFRWIEDHVWQVKSEQNSLQSHGDTILTGAEIFGELLPHSTDFGNDDLVTAAGTKSLDNGKTDWTTSQNQCCVGPLER